MWPLVADVFILVTGVIVGINNRRVHIGSRCVTVGNSRVAVGIFPKNENAGSSCSEETLPTPVQTYFVKSSSVRVDEVAAVWIRLG